MPCHPNCSCKKSSCESSSNTDSVIYTGEDLTCTGIDNGDTLTVVLQKLDEKYCEILSVIENKFPTTSTTTTFAPKSGSCVSPFEKLLEAIEPYVPSPNVITLTPSNQDGFFGILVTKESGSNPDNLNFGLQIARHVSGSCTGASSSFSFGATLDAGDASNFAGTTTQNSSVSARVVSLTVNGNLITTSPQTITVGTTTYIIKGYSVCVNL